MDKLILRPNGTFTYGKPMQEGDVEYHLEEGDLIYLTSLVKSSESRAIGVFEEVGDCFKNIPNLRYHNQGLILKSAFRLYAPDKSLGRTTANIRPLSEGASFRSLGSPVKGKDKILEAMLNDPEFSFYAPLIENLTEPYWESLRIVMNDPHEILGAK